MKKYLKLLFSRLTLVGLTIVILFIVDFAVAFGAIYFLNFILSYLFPSAAEWINASVMAISWLIVVATVLHIVNRDMVPEAKIPWLLCVIALQMFGVAIYAVFSYNRPTKKQRKTFRRLYERSREVQERTVSREELESAMGRWAGPGEALCRCSSAAVPHAGTKTDYFPNGEAFLESLLEDLERAEKYIFMEYFIIDRGKMWYSVLDVLRRKVKEGVEVRVMYDDIGSMGKIRTGYARLLRKEGIQCRKFNAFVPVISNIHNNRDHRKITVVDGRIGYVGGINLADEYINETHPFGHWKDTAVRMEGAGVRNLVLMFLQLYNLHSDDAEDFAPYIPERYETFADEGYVQPFGDGPRPLYSRSVGEDVYLNIINEAKRYVWITTPYLIIDYRLREALLRAAARGTDVRILTPHIPDKKVVFALTRSNYAALIKGGVKIYEYTPGFVHAKSFLADDEVGVVGTINLDYRSLLHHFECAVLMYRTSALVSLKRDLEETFAVSALQTEADAKKNVVARGLCEVAKVFAPLF